MVSKVRLNPVPEAELKKIKGLGAARVAQARWPKKEFSPPEARQALKAWQAGLPDPERPKNPEIPIRAVEPTLPALSKLTKVINSETAPAELLAQQLDERALIGTLYGAFLTFQFMRLQSEFKTRSAASRTRAAALSQWPETVGGFQDALSAAGLSGVTEAKLTQYAKHLAANRENLAAVTKVVNSAVVVDELPEGKAPPPLRGVIVPQLVKIPEPFVITTSVPNICSSPLAQGTFTKHFSHSFSLTVSFHAPCFPKVWKTCFYQFTIASVVFNLDINVGYKVNCCGASAWGLAAAQACATVVGKTFCATCTGSIVAVAGVSKNPVGAGNCAYGLGILAALVCKFGSSTVYSSSASFGWVVTGPCPPKILPC